MNIQGFLFEFFSLRLLLRTSRYFNRTLETRIGSIYGFTVLHMLSTC